MCPVNEVRTCNYAWLGLGYKRLINPQLSCSRRGMLWDADGGKSVCLREIWSWPWWRSLIPFMWLLRLGYKPLIIASPGSLWSQWRELARIR